MMWLVMLGVVIGLGILFGLYVVDVFFGDLLLVIGCGVCGYWVGCEFV